MAGLTLKLKNHQIKPRLSFVDWEVYLTFGERNQRRDRAGWDLSVFLIQVGFRKFVNENARIYHSNVKAN